MIDNLKITYEDLLHVTQVFMEMSSFFLTLGTIINYDL